MTRPARSDVNVTGTKERNVPANAVNVVTSTAATIAKKIAVHHAGCNRESSLSSIVLSRQVELTGLAVERQ
jgi:hypothetical protein